MRLLDRYLLREFLVPLAYCLGGFLIFWMAFDLFSHLRAMQEKHLRGGDILELYFFKAPEFLILVLPIALLLAVLYTLTNHSRHNEITAIRAAGISLWRMCLPYLGVGLVGSALLFALNEYCVPQTSEIADQIMDRRLQKGRPPEQRYQVKQFVFANARAGRFWTADVYNRRTGEMINARLRWARANEGFRVIVAERAALTNGVWTFYHTIDVKEGADVNVPRLPVATYPAFTETPAEMNNEIDISERLSIRSTKSADIPIARILAYLKLNPRPDHATRDWLFTKLHGRLAAPWACLVVVLLGVPFAAASGRRNVFVGVAASIFICLTYFILQQFAFAFGAAGRVPPWLAAWLPNLLFGITGLIMMMRVR